MDALSQLALIWVGVVVSVFLAKRTRLTPVLFFLAVGTVYVNLGVLPKEPHAFIRELAELGIVLIMFAIGFEERIDTFLESVRRSWGIALFGALAPFFTAYSLTWWFWQDFATSLLCGLAMTATAVSLTMVALKAEGIGQSVVATRIMTSAVLDDVASLALVALVVPLAVGGEMPGLIDVALMLGKVVAFFGLVAVLGAWVLPASPKAGLDLFNMRQLLSFENGEYAMLMLLLFAVAIGLLSHAFGFHPAVGAYMAGLIIRDEFFKYGDRPESNHEELRKVIDGAAFAWIGPVFFVLLGTHLVFDLDKLLLLFPQALLLYAALVMAQISSASLAARYTAGLDFSQSVMVGFGMLGRAELAFVVLDIAFVQFGVLSEDAFYVLMMVAFMLNVSVPLTIRFYKPYYLADHPDDKLV